MRPLGPSFVCFATPESARRSAKYVAAMNRTLKSPKRSPVPQQVCLIRFGVHLLGPAPGDVRPSRVVRSVDRLLVCRGRHHEIVDLHRTAEGGKAPVANRQVGEDLSLSPSPSILNTAPLKITCGISTIGTIVIARSVERTRLEISRPPSSPILWRKAPSSPTSQATPAAGCPGRQVRRLEPDNPEQRDRLQDSQHCQHARLGQHIWEEAQVD